jgi:hypothetical protein
MAQPASPAIIESGAAVGGMPAAHVHCAAARAASAASAASRAAFIRKEI